MIAYIQGTIEEISEDNVILEVNGIGYNIRIPQRVAQSLPGLGVSIRLHTYTLVREDAFQLYGFLSKNDLFLFKKCITVNGIGPKGALALLSNMDADSLKFAILSQDVKAIAKTPGIGQKTAERLILDLKDKLDYTDSIIQNEIVQSGTKSGLSDAASETIEALVALGYGQTESMKAVRQVEKASELDSEQLLRESLKKLF